MRGESHVWSWPDCQLSFWVLHAAYPELYQAIHAEINAAPAGPLNRDVDGSFSVLSAALMESRRLSDGVKIIMGSTRIDFNYTTKAGETYYIPKNWWVLLAIRTANLDETVHLQPLEFKADRFLGEDELQAQENMRLISQGEGPIEARGSLSGHACPGMFLALRLIKIAVISLVRGGYQWKLVDMKSPPPADVISSVTDGALLEYFR